MAYSFESFPFVLGAVALAAVASPLQGLASVAAFADRQILAGIELDFGLAPCLASAFAGGLYSSREAGNFAFAAVDWWPVWLECPLSR